MQNSCLKLTVLKILSRQQQNGYQLMKSIEAITGRKPSAGSMYPLLKELKEKKLINAKKQGRGTVYILTPHGKAKLAELLEHSKEVYSRIQEKVHLMENIMGKQTGVRRIMEKMKQGEPPFAYFTPELTTFRDLMLNVADKKLSPSQKQKIMHIIQTATRNIKEICNQS